MREVAAAYDAMIELYVEHVRGHLEGQTFDRAMLDIFVEKVGAAGPVADLGCGPGRITRYLADRGLDVEGMDLSPRMIETAREQHPDLRFREGTIESLDFADGTLAGLLAWYSLIHLPPERMPGVLSEFARVLRLGGQALLAFQSTEAPDVTAYDHRVTPAWLWPARRLSDAAREHGLHEVCRMVRRPDPDERSPQVYLLLAKER
ncbi:class I SAM-dependent methyltransferase [Nocardia bovistercoris]|uniref:Methyltransferase domain-containing protein n=1 Tax=Nocardia bovistercoris TaxID=2785916 RepID=A0A931IBW5_9NOCA|nr:class I SAM-dependent methyltransferase [Nocardia bovistercoris]MBH0778574.1 methyltransferase domain-containing protein [Nocardia bovistercoris]